MSWPSGPKSRPAATRLPSTLASRAVMPRGSSGPAAFSVSKAPVRSQYSAAVNAMRSRSRSTTMRVATDCTRPADSPVRTFFHSTGETS